MEIDIIKIDNKEMTTYFVTEARLLAKSTIELDDGNPHGAAKMASVTTELTSNKVKLFPVALKAPPA